MTGILKISIPQKRLAMQYEHLPAYNPSNSLLLCSKYSPNTLKGSSGLSRITFSMHSSQLPLPRSPYLLLSRQPLHPL